MRTEVEKAIDRALMDKLTDSRVTHLRDAILDAIEAAGFDIVRRETNADRFTPHPEQPPNIIRHRHYGGALGRTLQALDDKRADKVTEGVPLNPIEESEADD